MVVGELLLQNSESDGPMLSEIYVEAKKKTEKDNLFMNFVQNICLVYQTYLMNSSNPIHTKGINIPESVEYHSKVFTRDVSESSEKKSFVFSPLLNDSGSCEKMVTSVTAESLSL
jgi:hypothetical protein